MNKACPPHAPGASELPLRRFRACLFDLFHTLTNMEASGAPGGSTSEILEVDSRKWNHSLMYLSRERGTGRITDPVEILESVLRDIGESRPREMVEQAARERMRRFAYCVTHPPQESLEVLRSLRQAGMRLALVSNADVTEIAAWDQSPLAPLFDEVIFSCSVGCMKPDTMIYQIACERLGLEPADCLFIGDGGSHEHRGARAAGLTTCLVSGLISPRDRDQITSRLADADFHAVSLSEIYSAKHKESACSRNS